MDQGLLHLPMGINIKDGGRKMKLMELGPLPMQMAPRRKAIGQKGNSLAKL